MSGFQDPKDIKQIGSVHRVHVPYALAPFSSDPSSFDFDFDDVARQSGYKGIERLTFIQDSLIKSMSCVTVSLFVDF